MMNSRIWYSSSLYKQEVKVLILEEVCLLKVGRGQIRRWKAWGDRRDRCIRQVNAAGSDTKILG